MTVPISKKKLMVDMDGVLCDFIGSFRENYSEINKFPQSNWGFFATLKPIPTAIETVKELMEFYDVYILTRASYQNPLCYTEKRIWIENYFGLEFCDKIIMASKKNMVIGDYLIDDTTGNGQPEFVGEFIHYGSSEFDNWTKIKEYLISKL